jgi:hypothetical protein
MRSCERCRVVDRMKAIIVVSSKEVGIDLGVLVYFHFLSSRISKLVKKVEKHQTYHLESVELLLDLLGKHWCKAIAGCNLTSSVVFSTRPGIMELNSRAERSISLHSALWSGRYALGVALEPQRRHEVILPTQCHGASSSVSLLFLVRGTGCRRAWRFVDVGDMRKLEVW